MLLTRFNDFLGTNEYTDLCMFCGDLQQNLRNHLRQYHPDKDISIIGTYIV